MPSLRVQVSSAGAAVVVLSGAAVVVAAVVPSAMKWSLNAVQQELKQSMPMAKHAIRNDKT
jgi:hypothetical protein